ncbi:hypothetical protein ACS5PU_20655 [Pedobacter sp. GSP4]|uniref:hypothetical protein n=1 Tax=Pedobacter sp. GSP4 TaxID=3453716 RepID=UPI003EEA05F4
MVLTEQKNNYEKLINHWIDIVESSSLSLKDKRKKVIELCHYASFIISLINTGSITNIEDVKIIKLDEEPDIHISYNGLSVGLEIKRIVNEEAESVGRLKAILQKAELIYKQTYPSRCVLVNVIFEKSWDVMARYSQDNLGTELVGYISSTIEGLKIEKPSFIRSVKITQHTQTCIELAGTLNISTLTADRIVEEVDQKERKLHSYKTKNPELNEMWLLMVFSGVSPESSYDYVELPSSNFNTAFDKVFVLNDFKKEVYIAK